MTGKLRKLRDELIYYLKKIKVLLLMAPELDDG